MPITRFKCAPGYIQNGKKFHEFDYCIEKCTNRCCPTPMLQVLANELRTNPHKGKYISASALGGCRRSVYLERTTDHWAEPARQLYQPTRGSILHTLFETSDAENDDCLNEMSYYYDFRVRGSDRKWHTVRLNGTFDRYDKKNRTLTDYKTSNDFGLKYILKDGVKKEHVLQTNVYRWLLENGTHRVKNGEKQLGNFQVDNIKIIYLSMKTIIETGTIKYEVNNRSGELMEYNIGEVPIMSEQDVLDYILPNVKILDDAFERGVLPDPPDEDTQKWLCGTNFPNGAGYCQVKEHCDHWKELAEENGWIYNSNRRDV